VMCYFFNISFVDVSDVINSMPEKYLGIITGICEIMFKRNVFVHLTTFKL